MSAPSRRAVLAAPIALATAPVAAVPHISVPDVRADHPDADLVHLCQQHVANLCAVAALPSLGDDPEEQPVWQAYQRTMTAVGDARPQTLLGILAKARAAMCDAAAEGLLDGEHDAFAFNGHAWAWDLLQDLVRVHGIEVVDPREGLVA